jgi:hypothetical protein
MVVVNVVLTVVLRVEGGTRNCTGDYTEAGSDGCTWTTRLLSPEMSAIRSRSCPSGLQSI